MPVKVDKTEHEEEEALLEPAAPVEAAQASEVAAPIPPPTEAVQTNVVAAPIPPWVHFAAKFNMPLTITALAASGAEVSAKV